jgi:hypothetical protein
MTAIDLRLMQTYFSKKEAEYMYKLRTPFLAIGLMLFLSAPALAQQDTPKWDVSGGYSLLRDSEETLHGWLFSYTGNINPMFGIIGEVGGNYWSESAFGVDTSFNIYTYMVGAKVNSRQNASVTPFGQILFGGARGSFSVEGFDDSETKFAIQYSGGADIWMRPNVGVRVGVGAVSIFFEDETANDFRFNVGIVYSGGMIN